MLYLLNKIFVQRFYTANAGFFLFFFFIFFGAVQGGSLISYHLSLMNSILSSAITLSVVFVCWMVYHIKCIGFVIRIIRSEEGRFLYNLQAFPKRKQWSLYLLIYTFIYAPVLLYSILLVLVGFHKGFPVSSISVLVFQIISIALATLMLFKRFNNWISRFHLPAIRLSITKPFLFYLLHYFWSQKKTMLLLIKALSLALLYIVLVWNRGSYDNDSFVLFYLVILMAHVIIPYLSIQFFERDLAITRNLPVPIFKRAGAYLIPYILILLPELAYILIHAHIFSFEQKVAYFINAIATLSLLTAFLYNEATGRDEYLKASFGLLFFSIFALHIQAFWVWIAIQLTIAILLFANGYYKYEKVEEE